MPLDHLVVNPTVLSSIPKSPLAPMLDNILAGMVRYGEKDMTGYNLIRFLYTKQHHFEKEHELRTQLLLTI